MGLPGGQRPARARLLARAARGAGLSRALWFCGLCLLVACGDDDEPAAATRGAGGPARPTAKPAAAKAAGGAAANPNGPIDENRLPAKLRGLTPEDWEVVGDLPVLLRESRDPFLPHVADLVEVKAEVVEAENDPQLDIQIKIAESVQSLKLIAVVTGSGVPHAMVADSRGLGHMLIPGDVVGAEIPFRVARITRNEVLFKPLQAPEGEDTLTEVSKVLLTQQELEDLLP